MKMTGWISSEEFVVKSDLIGSEVDINKIFYTLGDLMYHNSDNEKRFDEMIYSLVSINYNNSIVKVYNMLSYKDAVKLNKLAS